MGLFSPDMFAGKSVLITGAGPWAEDLANAFRQGGASVSVTGCLTEPEEITAAFEGCDGPVDILVNGPAPRLGQPAEATRQADWRQVAGPGYDGVFLCCGEFVRRRIAAGARGWILNLIDTPPVGHAAETAASAGVANLIKTLGAEWARDGVRVNGLSCPDWEKAPPETLKAMALYLCSPYSGFVTASRLSIVAVPKSLSEPG